MLALLICLLFAMMGGAAALAERSDFDHTALAAKTTPTATALVPYYPPNNGFASATTKEFLMASQNHRRVWRKWCIAVLLTKWHIRGCKSTSAGNLPTTTIKAEPLARISGSASLPVAKESILVTPIVGVCLIDAKVSDF
jgi:hypothetical protein